MYQPRGNNVFARKEPILICLERSLIPYGKKETFLRSVWKRILP